MSAIAEKPDKEKRRREILDAAFLRFSTNLQWPTARTPLEKQQS